MICQAGATEDGKYVDPERVRLVTVDHEKATITSSEEIPESDRNAKVYRDPSCCSGSSPSSAHAPLGQVEALRAPTQTAVAQYAAGVLPKCSPSPVPMSQLWSCSAFWLKTLTLPRQTRLRPAAPPCMGARTERGRSRWPSHFAGAS